MSTGESWNGIMHDSMITVSNAAWIYYVSYMIIVSYLLMQLIVAVVLEQFSSAQGDEEAPVRPDDVEAFSISWREFDPTCKQYISDSQLPILFKALDKPLGLNDPDHPNAPPVSGTELMTFYKKLELDVHGGRAHYLTVFFALLKNAYKSKFGKRWDGDIPPDVLHEMTLQLTTEFPTIDEISDEDSKPALENFAAIKIQAIARARLGKKKSAAKAGAMSSLISDVLAESPIGKAKVDALAAPQDDGAAVAPASPEQLEQPPEGDSIALERNPAAQAGGDAEGSDPDAPLAKRLTPRLPPIGDQSGIN
jgi:hypothetical protein